MGKRGRSDAFGGIFGKYFLPGIVLQSVLIGGGYATGREIVEFGAKFGALGWFGGIGIFLGFSLISVLTFEMCRLFRNYNLQLQELYSGDCRSLVDRV